MNDYHTTKGDRVHTVLINKKVGRRACSEAGKSPTAKTEFQGKAIADQQDE